jgi:hypothetical protein
MAAKKPNSGEIAVLELLALGPEEPLHMSKLRAIWQAEDSPIVECATALLALQHCDKNPVARHRFDAIEEVDNHNECVYTHQNCRGCDIIEGVNIWSLSGSDRTVPEPVSLMVKIGHTTLEIPLSGGTRVPLNIPIIALQNHHVDIYPVDAQGRKLGRREWCRIQFLHIYLGLPLRRAIVAQHGSPYKLCYAGGAEGGSALPPFVCKRGLAQFGATASATESLAPH